MNFLSNLEGTSAGWPLLRPPPFPKGSVFAFLGAASLPVEVVPALLQASIPYFRRHLMHDTCQVIWKPNYFKYDWLERFSKDCSQGIQSVLLNSCFAIRFYPHEIAAFKSISQKSPKSHQSLLLRWITVMFWWNLSCLSAGWPCRRRLCAAIFWETNKSHHFASSLPSSVETRSPYWSIKRRSS